MKKVFELLQIRLLTSRYVLRKTQEYPLGFFSSLNKACDAIQRSIVQERLDAENGSLDGCMGYIINEKLLNTRYGRDILFIHTYTREGKLNDECFLNDEQEEIRLFYGRPVEKIRFKVGDIVEAYSERYGAELSIVGMLPPSVKDFEERKPYWETLWEEEGCPEFLVGRGGAPWDAGDDCYLLYSLGEGDTHSHVISPYVFAPTKKVSKNLERKLREKLIEMQQYGKNENE